MKEALIGVIAVTAIALVALFVVQLNSETEDGESTAEPTDRVAAIEKALNQSATELRKDLPRKIGENTELTGVSVDGLYFTYELRMLATGEELRAANFTQRQREALRQSVCSQPDMATSLKDGVVFIYRYYDIENTLLQTFTFSAGECGLEAD